MGNFVLAALVVLLVGAGLYSYSHLHGFVIVSQPAAVTSAIPVQPTASTTVSQPPSNTPRTATVFTSIGEGAEQLGLALTPTRLVDDSRCPIDVTCIQAGTVRVETRLGDNWNGSLYVFTLGQSVQVKGWIIELIDVSPLRSEGQVIHQADYRFTYRITLAPSVPQ